MTYNLLDEAWIPVVFRDGESSKLSLSDVLLMARDIRSVGGEVPQMLFALLRLMLAVLYRAYFVPDPTKEELVSLWKDLWEQGHFDKGRLCDYFEYVHDSFDLLGDKPFYQVSDLNYEKGHIDPVCELMVDVPKPEKFLFSLRVPQHVHSLPLDEAALYLILEQAYSKAGNKTPVKGNTHVSKGKAIAPSGKVKTGWCGALGGVYLGGANLFETLMLNWVLFDPYCSSGNLLGMDKDLPPWERPVPESDLVIRDPVGPVDMLTWQSRRIRLVADEDGKSIVGVILCYGDATTEADRQGYEQMCAWKEAKSRKTYESSHVPLVPATHQPSKAIWRGLPSLVSSEGGGKGGRDTRPGVVRWAEGLSAKGGLGLLPEDYRMFVGAQGISYDKPFCSVIVDGIDDRMDLSLVLFQHDGESQRTAIDVILKADNGVKVLSDFVRDLEKTRGDKRWNSKDKKIIYAIKNDVRERAYDELDALFRARLAGLDAKTDLLEYKNSWLKEVFGLLWSIAQDCVSMSGTSLFAERGQVTAGRALVMLRQRLGQVLLD